jgi:hypothetical protein
VSWLLPPDACVATIKLYPSRNKSSVIGSRDYRHVLQSAQSVMHLFFSDIVLVVLCAESPHCMSICAESPHCMSIHCPRSCIGDSDKLPDSGPGSYRFVEHLALRAVSRAPNLIGANRSVAPVKAR